MARTTHREVAPLPRTGPPGLLAEITLPLERKRPWKLSTLAAARRSRPVASLAGSSRTAATPGTVFDTLRAALSRADVPEADRQLFGIVFDELLRRAPLDQARLRATTAAIRVRSV